MSDFQLLALADLKGMKQDALRQHVKQSYEYAGNLDHCTFWIAYESVGSWGRDSTSFFVFYNEEDGKLYENHGSHCSCNGFERQWAPEETSIEYLTSDKFMFYSGGYDEDRDENEDAILGFIRKLKEDAQS